MDRKAKAKLLKTAGYVTIGVGFYMVFKASQLENYLDINFDKIIDAEFEIIED